MKLVDALRQSADAKGIPLRTLENVREALTKAKRAGSDAPIKRMMLKHGRLTDEARQFVENW